MFDIASSKLLILGLVALIVIGPKDLPALLRTLGKYMGMIRKHANDFRSQFEDAMRESELDELKKQVQNVGQETEAAMREAETSIEKHLGDARASIDPDKMLGADPFAEPAAPPAPAASDATAAPMPASSDPIADTPPPAATPPETAARAAEKTGA